jgi:hypothetical protein
MSIRYKTDMEWFQMVYLKTDAEQEPWQLVGILITPNGQTFTLANKGETIDVYDGEFTTEVNTELKLGIENDID